MMYPRKSDWPHRLVQYLAAQSGQPFVWGERDCCAFACDAVVAMTGNDPLIEHRGGYHTALGARRILNRIGGVEGFARGAFGEPVRWTMLRRGDVALIDAGRNEVALAIVLMDGQTVIAPGPHAPTARAAQSVLMGWRIG